MTVISLIFSWLFLEVKNMKMKFSKTYVAVVCLCIASSQSNLNVSSSNVRKLENIGKKNCNLRVHVGRITRQSQMLTLQGKGCFLKEIHSRQKLTFERAWKHSWVFVCSLRCLHKANSVKSWTMASLKLGVSFIYTTQIQILQWTVMSRSDWPIYRLG